MAKMVAEMVSSVAAQETCSQILSGLVNMYREKEDSSGNRNLERLEMAHIRMEAALETSEKWHIVDASLLRWRTKLKRAAQECDDMVHKCKQRILEDEQMESEVRNSSLPNRIAHATKSFVYSVFNCKNELSRSVVQRFEGFADGASEFLRFIELGGTPWRHVPFDSLVKNLFAGKELHYKTIHGGSCPLFQLWLVPFRTAETGMEAGLIFIQKDGSLQKSNIFFKMIIQLSESTDIVGIAIKCLELFAPHFKYTTENIRKELAQLHTRHWPWVPSVYQREDRDILHDLGSQWYRPNPLCCKQHDQNELRCTSNIDTAGSSDVSLEPVIEVNLRCQVPLLLYNKQKTSPSEDIILLQDSSFLNAGISFAPHRNSEDMLPANSSAIVVIVGKDEHFLHTDITLEQLEEIMLPKAIDYFFQNVEATVYQMLWKSKHGSALIQVDRPKMSKRRTSLRTHRTFGRSRKRSTLQRQDQEIRTREMYNLVELWGAHMSVQLRKSLMDWVRKEKEWQLITPHLYLPPL